MPNRFTVPALLFFWYALGSGLEAANRLTLHGVYRPYGVTVGHQRAYITEETTVHVFSLISGKKIKSFGKGGEGPQEFRGRIYKIDILPKRIVVNSVGRLSHFSLDGDFIKQQDTAASNVNYMALGDRYVGMKLKVVDGSLFFAINLYDKKLALLKEIYLFKHPFQRRGYINPADVRVCSFHVHGGHIYIDHTDGTIGVYSPQGCLTRKIKFDVEPVRITKPLQQRYMNFWKKSRMMSPEYRAFKDRLRFPAYFPPIRDFQIDDNKLYVLTHKEKDLHNELVILDTSGKELKREWVPLAEVDMLIPQVFNYSTIHQDTIYILSENPDTEVWELSWYPL